MKIRNYDALFINGVFENLLNEIVAIQQAYPEQILYLQPAAAKVIAELRKSPPTITSPIRLFVSTTDLLSVVSFEGEIIKWQDKRDLLPSDRSEILHTLRSFQQEEGRFADETDDGSVNILSISRMRKLSETFSVDKLIKSSDGQPLSNNRSRAGGWSYVNFGENLLSNRS